MWILILLQAFIFSEQIYINEIVSDNDGIIMDFQGDSPDWIELYNPNNYDVNLYDYSLSDNKENPIRWTFPRVIIKANSFLVIFCSGKDTIVGNEVHTNFNISSEGEELFLYDNNPIIIKRKKLDFIEIPRLRENKAYGKLPDGNGKLSYLSTYSPNKTNIYSDEITCNFESGFYKDSITVELKSTMGYEIRYTLDGRDPDENSPIYTKPITLYNSSDKPNKYCEIQSAPTADELRRNKFVFPKHNIDKLTFFKFKSYFNKEEGSKIHNNTYFVGNYEKYKNIPIISINVDSSSLFSQDTGFYVPGIHYDESNPLWSGNYFQYSGKEKLAHFTSFNEKLEIVHNQNVYISLLGNGSRVFPQKSLKVTASNINGPDELLFDLHNSKTKEFKSIKLKSAYGIWVEFNIMQNELASELSQTLNFEKLNYKPALLFLNGEYWGIQTITEHKDKDYLKQFHNEDKDSVEKIMHHIYGPIYNDGYGYYDLIDFIENNSLENDQNYRRVEKEIDIDSYIDYYLFQIIVRNLDWPYGNILCWKSSNTISKWRWILYDLDGAFDNFDIKYNMFEHLLQDKHDNWPNSSYSTFTFRSLIKNENFKNKLVNRCKEILNKEFDFDFTSNLYFKVRNYYIPFMENHYKRWGYPTQFENNWQHGSDTLMLNFLKNRPSIVLEHLEDFINITSNNLDDCYGNQCDDNGIEIFPNPNNGQFNIKSIEKYKNSSILVYSNVGKEVHKSKVYINEGEQINFTFLPNGVYFIKFENQFGQYTFKRVAINK